MLRLISVFGFLLLTACASTGAQIEGLNGLPIDGPETVCRQTEQQDCLELDVLNLVYDESHPQMVGLQQPPRSLQERERRVADLGPTMYQGWKDGRVKSAKSRQFTVYFWNVTDTSVSQMSAYKLSHSGRLTRHAVREGGRPFEGQFDPLFDLGQPDRTFTIIADGPGAALQIPWSMVTGQTYVLVCGDEDNVYPNRQTAYDGLWLTKQYLAYMRGEDWEYVLMPFLSKS